VTGKYHQAARDFVSAFDGDAGALSRLNQYYERQFTFDDLKAEVWRRVYAFRQRASREFTNYLKLEEAQIVLAQDAGFSSWTALLEAAENASNPARLRPVLSTHAKFLPVLPDSLTAPATGSYT